MFLRKLITPLLCFIFFFLIITPGCISFPFTNETDRQALLAIKDQILEDPFLVFRSWNDSVHFCYWQGITCSFQHHQRVTVLKLSSLGLVGTVSSYIGNLTFLRTIDLGNNSFHHQIPPEIGRLFRLQYLLLWNNSFQGEFPSNLTQWPDSRVINVANNNLGGKIQIPTELGTSLSNLLQLNIANNHFTGTIPPSIGNLSSLRVLCLAINNLEGSIPLQLGQLSKLEVLQLSINKFSGMVPISVYNLSSIYYFSITGNLFQGSLPSDLGSTLPKLRGFYVDANLFYGPVPSLTNASGLVQIDVGNNSFIGPLPMTLGTLGVLQVFNAFSNSLGTNEGNELGNFFTSLSNCSNLQFLALGENGFKDVLPNSIANLSNKMTWLSLEDNYISGSIPLGIGNLVNLQTLYLSQNTLTSIIPDSIGKLTQLEKLLLNTNNISGEIPSSIGNLTRLGILDIPINMLEGSIPASLGNCTNLRSIYLGYNHLSGSIPQEIFGLSSLFILNINQNELSGLLPLEVGNSKNLGKLDVSDNKLSGVIPGTLGSCQVLEILYLEGNLFEGTIPASIKQLKGLQVLDVSRNNLSGLIPRFLGELPLFQNLNLSYNMFDGEVPTQGVFTNTSAFSVVGNNQLCGGIQVLQLPLCPTNVLKERKHSINSRVIALVVTLTIVLSLVFLSAILYRIRKSKQQASPVLPTQSQYLRLSYGELFQATNGFSLTNLIGEGGYGSVYKGILNSIDRIVAVKVLNVCEQGANVSFIAECEALKRIRHRNLVKIITSCSTIDFIGNDFKALVFEFMENGSLESWLHPNHLMQDPKKLNFVQRLNIAIDVASALDYLHHHCEMTFIHCDLKPSNILLDDEFCARVGDFGLAKILSATTVISNHQQLSSSGIRGTIGYVAPEYGMGKEVSIEGDMYSFGVLLLEMFTGKRSTDNMFIDNISLHNYVKLSLPDQVLGIVDPRIIANGEEELANNRQTSTTNISKLEVCLVSVLQLGVSCSAEFPIQRLNARDVLLEMQRIKNVFLGVKGQGLQDERIYF